MIESLVCPLCLSSNHDLFHQAVHQRGKVLRDYYRCHCCSLVFVPASQHLTLQAEKAIYDQHENQLDDPGYRQFLSRLATPLVERLQPNISGLDFGCGPSPALAAMLQESGFQMTVYDPFYAPNTAAVKHGNTYDFITATEVLEHLRKPREVLQQLLCLLKPGGKLGVMTKRVSTQAAFARWHYIRDLTHIVFFSVDTFLWLQNNFYAMTAEGQKITLSGCEFVADDVVLFDVVTCA